MTKLSNGDDSTLKSYRKLAVTFFGDKSKAVKLIDEKIKESIYGENAEVLTDESQMIQLLAEITADSFDSDVK
jgi:hypothetical protein